MNEKGMHILEEKDLLLEMKGLHLEKCVDCLVGKQNKVAFHSRPPMRRECVLELFHKDVCYGDAQSLLMGGGWLPRGLCVRGGRETHIHIENERENETQTEG